MYLQFTDFFIIYNISILITKNDVAELLSRRFQEEFYIVLQQFCYFMEVFRGLAYTIFHSVFVRVILRIKNRISA